MNILIAGSNIRKRLREFATEGMESQETSAEAQIETVSCYLSPWNEDPSDKCSPVLLSTLLEDLEDFHDASAPIKTQGILWERFLSLTAHANLELTENICNVARERKKEHHRAVKSDLFLLSKYCKPDVIDSLEFDGDSHGVQISFRPIFHLSASFRFWLARRNESLEESLEEKFRSLSACPFHSAVKRQLEFRSLSNLHEVHLLETKIDHNLTIDGENAMQPQIEWKNSVSSRPKSDTRAIVGQSIHVAAELLKHLPWNSRKKMSRIEVVNFLLSGALRVGSTPKKSSSIKERPLPPIFAKSVFDGDKVNEKYGKSKQDILHHPDLLLCGKMLFLAVTDQLRVVSIIDLLNITVLSEKQGEDAAQNSHISSTQKNPCSTLKSILRWDPVVISMLWAHMLSHSTSTEKKSESNRTLIQCICNGKVSSSTGDIPRMMRGSVLSSANIGDRLTGSVAIFALGLLNQGRPSDFLASFLLHVIFHRIETEKDRRFRNVNSSSSSPVDTEPVRKKVSRSLTFPPAPSNLTYFKYFSDFETITPTVKTTGTERVASFKELAMDNFVKIISAMAYGTMCFQSPLNSLRFDMLFGLMQHGDRQLTEQSMVDFIGRVSQGEFSLTENAIDHECISCLRGHESIEHQINGPYSQENYSQTSSIFLVLIYGISLMPANSLTLSMILLFPFWSDSVGLEPATYTDHVSAGISPSETFTRFLFAYLNLWGFVEATSPSSCHSDKSVNRQTQLAFLEHIVENLRSKYMKNLRDPQSEATLTAQQSAYFTALAIRMASTCDISVKRTLLDELRRMLRDDVESTCQRTKQQAFLFLLVSLSIVAMGSRDREVFTIINAVEYHSNPSVEHASWQRTAHETQYDELFRSSKCFSSMCDHNFLFIMGHYCALAKVILSSTIPMEKIVYVVLAVLTHSFLDVTSADLSVFAPFMRFLLTSECEETRRAKDQL